MTDDERPAARALRDAFTLLNKIEADSNAMDERDALGYIVVCHDPETGTTSYHGPAVADPVVALTAADTWETELNAGNGPNDAPFKVSVARLMPLTHLEA